MCRLDDRFNNAGVDENVSIFHNIGNIYNLEIGFRLGKTRSYDILQINDIYILDVTLNSIEIRLRCNFIGYNNESLMVYINKVSHDLKLNVL